MRVRVAVPTSARVGEIIEIRAVAGHPMETGFRRDAMGRAIARDILTEFRCSFDGREVFRAELFPAIAANPYLTFFTTATRSGRFEFRWVDQDGTTTASHADIVVE